jgi:hypothetical protein
MSFGSKCWWRADRSGRSRRRRGTQLLRQRGERLAQPFAHLYETGRMRRVYLRGHTNILKRVQSHTAALNLGLLMPTLWVVGTPRSPGAPGCASLLRGVPHWVPQTLWDVIWHHVPPSCLSALLAHREFVRRP